MSDESRPLSVPTLRIDGDATKLFEALAKAQAEFEAIPEDAQGQIGKDRRFKYADFMTLIRHTRPYLVKHGLLLIQPLHYQDGMAVTTTIIAGHGARIESSFAFGADPNPQEFGRAHTYYRRYQLQAILGIEGEDADEARSANEKRNAAFVEKEPVKKTNGKAESKPPVAQAQPALDAEPAPKVAEDQRPVNTRIIDGMKQLSWKMDDLKAFYKAEIDKKGFDKADNLPAETKEKLWQLMVQKKGVAPFGLQA